MVDEAPHKMTHRLETMLIGRAKRALGRRIQQRQTAETANDGTVGGPETGQRSDELGKRVERRRARVGFTKCGDKPSSGNVAEEGVPQTFLGAELVVDRHARHAGARRHGVDREPFAAVIDEQILFLINEF